MKELTTERLVLSPISIAHCTEQYIAWLNDPDVYKYLETRGNYTLEMLKNYLLAVVESKVLMWAIHIKDGKKHIGNIKIDPIKSIHGLGEYGILMGEKSEQGKDYAREASEAVIKYCFEEKNLRKLTLGVVQENEAAVKLYYKIGFATEGVYKKHVCYDGKFYDVIRMAIFNSKFKYDQF